MTRARVRHPEPTGQALRIRENHLRLIAARRGLVLHKCRRRDPLALDFGMYALTNSKVTPTAFPLTYRDVEAALGPDSWTDRRRKATR